MLVTLDTKPARPQWLRAPAPVGDRYRDLKDLVTSLNLHTVCESAACPNIGECWNRGTATFMILGNVCTAPLRILRGAKKVRHYQSITTNRAASPKPCAPCICATP